MDADALREWDFWEHLDDENRDLNAYGLPPYNVVDVAWMVLGMLRPSRYTEILDLGCGPGRLATAVADRAPVSVIACDISQAMLDRVPIRPDVRPCVLDGRTLPDRVDRVNHAYSVAMLQHVPHEAQQSYISQVVERLYGGGRFAFTVAIGDIDEFLNHQVSMQNVIDWLRPMVPYHHFADGRGWQWFVAEKP